MGGPRDGYVEGPGETTRTTRVKVLLCCRIPCEGVGLRKIGMHYLGQASGYRRRQRIHGADIVRHVLMRQSDDAPARSCAEIWCGAVSSLAMAPMT